ncbi:MAG: hypothetical protein AAFX87_24270 [Bacteroidota bacterium]
MSNNTFNIGRFLLLLRQHFIHNNKLLLFATVAYIGVVFLILSIGQIGNDFEPHDLETFRGFLIAFVIVFGILYVGYSFPAFRSKESTINYLLVPCSVTEKFTLEFITRVGVMIILLPLLYWVTFHLQGYFFTFFHDYAFSPISIGYLVKLEVPEKTELPWLTTLIGSLVILGFVLPFTGASMFSKQPLIKTLFSVAIIVIFYVAVIYIAIEPLGLGKYNPNESVWLIPNGSQGASRLFAVAAILANLVMLFVAYRKIKEREV